jgi:hypothetical protein
MRDGRGSPFNRFPPALEIDQSVPADRNRQEFGNDLGYCGTALSRMAFKDRSSSGIHGDQSSVTHPQKSMVPA